MLLDYSGSTNYVLVNKSLPSAALTIELWLKLPMTQPLSNPGEMGTGNFSIECGTGLPSQCTFSYYDGSSYHYPGGVTQIANTNWHLFAVTLDGNNTVTLYLDGLQTAAYSMTAHVAFSSSFEIGHGWSNYGAATINDVRVYNRALSAAQIAAMYNGGK